MFFLDQSIPVPNSTLRVVPKALRISYSACYKVGSIYLVSQLTQTGRKQYVTISDGREIVYATLHPDLMGCYFYRSFAGTGGKKQFEWYPIGGVYYGINTYSNVIRPIWIIKGSPSKDPYYGREALSRLMNAVNESLPHSDTEVDKFFGIKSGWDTSPEVETVPFIINTVTTHRNEKDVLTVFDLWKVHVLNKVFGQRGEDKNAPVPKQENAPVQQQESVNKAYDPKWLDHIHFDENKKYHLASERIPHIKPRIDQVSGERKPHGLWYACGIEWKEWLESEMPQWLDEVLYVYEVIPGRRMLYIRNSKQLLEFNQRFGVVSGYRDNSINWPAVASLYSGIEICPYLGEHRLDPRVDWYYTWDVASGCLWGPDVHQVKLIAKRADAP